MKHILFITFILLGIPFVSSAQTTENFRGELTPQAPRYFMLVHGDMKIPVSEEAIQGWKIGNTKTTNLLTASSKPTVELLMAGYTGNLPFGSNIAVPTSQNIGYDTGKIYAFVKDHTAFLKKEPVEPYLEIKNNKAVKFMPPEDGIMPDVYSTTFDIIKAIEQQATSTAIAINVKHPNTTLSQTNTLGITELVARGTSSFKGSPYNRRHNIKIGVEKMTGIIVAPGEEFSFNKHLGEVDGANGFLPELVIKATGTVPEFGGGLCQVSSTAFRAAMDGGFPITQRRNHAYAVQYYAPQGTDATIYPGVIDMKFMNDTPGHLLVWPYYKDKDTIIFDFYGTKDDRIVKLGTPYQYDKKTDGSMKATWEREVTKNGETKKDVFKSVYRPPALYHKKEEFGPSSTSTPASTTPPPTTPAPAI